MKRPINKPTKAINIENPVRPAAEVLVSNGPTRGLTEFTHKVQRPTWIEMQPRWQNSTGQGMRKIFRLHGTQWRVWRRSSNTAGLSAKNRLKGLVHTSSSCTILPNPGLGSDSSFCGTNLVTVSLIVSKNDMASSLRVHALQIPGGKCTRQASYKNVLIAKINSAHCFG
jgi:hypothetical protein